MSTVHLLAGLPGSGKSTYARTLEDRGVVRLSVDERVASQHGLLGADYPAAMHFELARPIVDTIRQELMQLLRERSSVVLDHALDRRSEREGWKALVTAHGGNWRLVYFKADRNLLLRRLASRNAGGGVGEVTPAMLDWMAANWEKLPAKARKFWSNYSAHANRFPRGLVHSFGRRPCAPSGRAWSRFVRVEPLAVVGRSRR
jgi:predicted kinase